MSHARMIPLPHFLLAVAVGIATLVLPTPQAQAAEFTVNTTVDSNDGMCEQPPSGDCTLREAIRAANQDGEEDTIVLMEDATYALTLSGPNEDAALTGDLDVTSTVTIRGNEATVDASALGDRVFDIREPEMGSNPDIGLVAEDLTITGGTATADTGTEPPSNRGGGVRVVVGTLVLLDSTVEGNTATVAGGGVENFGQSLIASATLFANNTATGEGGQSGNGGAVHAGDDADGNPAFTQVTASMVRGNRAVEGGGVWNGGGAELEVFDDTTFQTNTARGAAPGQGGGALYNEGRGILKVSATLFEENTAVVGAGSGGAILNNAENTLFSGDFAVTVNGSLFFGNEANRAGGAIEQAAGTAVVSTSVFVGNEAKGGARNAPGNGGAIHNGDETEMAVGASAFRRNEAVVGGALWTSGSMTLREVEVRFNAARREGGAFYNESGGTFKFTEVDARSGGVEFDRSIQGNVYAVGEGATRASATGSMFTDGQGTAEPTCEVIVDAAEQGDEGPNNTDDDGTCFDADSPPPPPPPGDNEAPRAPRFDALDDVNAANEESYRVSGSAEPGSTVDVTIRGRDGTVRGSTTAGEDGRFSLTLDVSELDDGELTVLATATDDAGNTSRPAMQTVRKDATPPPAPTIDQARDITEDNEDDYLVEGDAEQGSLVTVTATDEDGEEVTGTDEANSPYEVMLDASGLSDGDITLTATATDNAGNTSQPTTSTVEKDTGDDVTPPGDNEVEIERIFGAGRTETAIEISRREFGDDEAGAVVLTRPDIFPDALAGTPLAVQENAPLLLTATEGLESAVATEMLRVLPDGATVYLLGGVQALSEQVRTDVEALGLTVTRLGGANRFDTAAIIATDGIDTPTQVLLADGSSFADAITAGAAAGATGGAVVLTGADTVPAETQALLDAIGQTRLFAIGGPAARAVPTATAVLGADRVATSAAVATEFFDAPTVAGLATAVDFPDALAGGAAVGRGGGPMLLTFPDTLGQPVNDYLTANRASLRRVVLFGGIDALNQTVEDAVTAILTDAG